LSHGKQAVPVARVAKTDLALVHQAIACLGRLADAFRRRREQLALSVGLSDGQWGVLEEISREHFMPSMFAKTRDSSAAAVSKTLRQLLDKDLVSVTLSKSDGRQRDLRADRQRQAHHASPARRARAGHRKDLAQT
jgi:DNA-binding MarR family transcriptional regulator